MYRVTVCTVALITAVCSEQTVIFQPNVAPLKMIEGNQVKLSCTIKDGHDSSKLKYKWSTGERTISRKSSISLIGDRHMFDDGNLTCTVRNASYVEYGTASVAVSVQYPPEAFSQRSHLVFRGEDVSICQGISGNPPPGIVKYKRVGVTSGWVTSHCRIRQVKASHSGDYIVVMKNTMSDNIHKEERTGTGVQLVRLLVLYGARVICPRNYAAVENTTAVLECRVDAYPPAAITWTREGSPEALPQTGSYLRIPHAQLSDGGNYICTASNTLSDYTGRIHNKEDSCTIHVFVRVNMSDGASPETTSVFAIYKIHFIAASLGIVVLAFLVVDVVRCIRRRYKVKGGDVPVEVDGQGDIQGKRTDGNKQDYEQPSPDNQMPHDYKQVLRDGGGHYRNVATGDPHLYGNVFPEEHSGYYSNVTVQERKNMCYSGKEDAVMKTHSREYVNW